MTKPYSWRSLTVRERDTVLTNRKLRARPWHSPPHRQKNNRERFHVTAACFEHKPIIGLTPERMDAFTDELLAACDLLTRDIFAWCVLPNHYHLLVHAPVVILQATRLKAVLRT